MQNNQDKISVIVPVYKVERYLRQCVESILAQTYGNLEIILINDGSPDNCGAICDEYAGQDSRIKVIHRENGGVSAARNTGIDAASGEYLAFIDSDDWIEPDMLEVLHNSLIAHGAALSCCGYYAHYRTMNVPINPISNGGIGGILLDNRQAVREMLLNRRIKTFLCGKLYRKNLFDEIRCPVGMAYCEDVFVIAGIFLKAQNVAVAEQPKYYYRQRKSSAVHGGHSLKMVSDGIRATRHVRELIKEAKEAYSDSAELSELIDLIDLSECNIISAHIAALKKMVYHRGFRRLEQYKEAVAVVRGNYSLIIGSPYFNKADKISAVCIKISIMLFKAVHILYRKSGKISNKALFD